MILACVPIVRNIMSDHQTNYEQPGNKAQNKPNQLIKFIFHKISRLSPYFCGIFWVINKWISILLIVVNNVVSSFII